MKDAGVAPVPGMTPIQNPRIVPVIQVNRFLHRVLIVTQISFKPILPWTPLNSNASSAAKRISPTPKRPIEAVMKLNPLNNVMEPKLRRGRPVTMSSPQPARRKPTHAEPRGLGGGPPPSPATALTPDVW